MTAVGAIGGCGAGDPESPDPIVPALNPRPDVRTCMAGVDIPEDPEQAIAFPASLSETGCFEPSAGEPGAAPVPAADLVPFRVNAPLWTDGVLKQRYLAVPPGAVIEFADTGAWEFPDGAVLVKQFTLEAEAGVPASRRVLETRFMLRARGAWSYASYRWNDAGTDAALTTGAVTVRYDVVEDGETRAIEYDYPSEMGCRACHAEVSGEALGPRTEQLSRVLNYADGARNQLIAMAEIGLFDGVPAPEALAALPALIDPADESAPLEQRARTYLHANCAHCHQPGGYNSTVIDIDLRLDVPLAEARACGEPIHHTIHIRDGALLIDPGDPDNSNVYGRMLSSGVSKMPPIGRSITDPLGSELVRAWIEGLAQCP